MITKSFFIKGIAHSSYLLGGSRTCAIIDPERSVSRYIDAAKQLNMKITHILQTHLHADFISGHMDLAEITGARIIAPKSANCTFDHIGVENGDMLEIDDLEIRIVETPGHTPEHVSYIVVDRARGSEPAALFCGDTLFVGDVGRPDLFPGLAHQLADQLYSSLHDILLKLPDFCEVYPAHGAGSLCGRAMGAKRSSTIGYEKKYNPALLINSKSEFIRSLTTDMPPAPDHFSRCSAINASGPQTIHYNPPICALSPEQFRDLTHSPTTIILDIRSYESFGGQFIPDSYHIDINGNFATFAGWVLPPDAEIIIVASSFEQAWESRSWLNRVGLDTISGYLDGGIFEWAKKGYPLEHVRQISAFELHEAISKVEMISIIDVRSPSEFSSYHIDGAINIPAPDLRKRYNELHPDWTNVLICSTGHRSSLGCSILKQNGFKNIINVGGGMTAYSASGFAPECPLCVTPHGPKFMGITPKTP
ncbi:MBL fold metallo-hydrolase [bacterium]|nr:MBL fold metallo-hydrolase [candidate division CSSED10-310 bacterium]